MSACDRAYLVGRIPHEQHYRCRADADDGWLPGEARPTGGFRHE